MHVEGDALDDSWVRQIFRAFDGNLGTQNDKDSFFFEMNEDS
jgi:hypothetical protein